MGVAVDVHVGYGPELLTPPEMIVPSVGKAESVVEFDNGYGAETLGATPGVPPVGSRVPVTEAAVGGLLDCGGRGEPVGSVVAEAADCTPGNPVPVATGPPVGPDTGRVELVRG